MDNPIQTDVLYSTIELSDSQGAGAEQQKITADNDQLEEYKSEIRINGDFTSEKTKDSTIPNDRSCYLDIELYMKLKTNENPHPECNLLLVILGTGSNFEELADKIIKFAKTLPKFRRQKGDCHKTPVHIKILDWRACLDQNLKQGIEKATLSTNKLDRKMLNQIPSDLLFYLRPEHSCNIVNEVVFQANKCFKQFKDVFPNVKVSLVGHSLGSVILYDIVSQNFEKKFLNKKPPNDLKFDFPCEHIFLVGSPLSIFQSINGDRIKPLEKFGCCKGFYNIFHPNDLLAYRIEPLIDNGKLLEPMPVSWMVNYDIKNLNEKERGFTLSFLSFCSIRDKVGEKKEGIAPRKLPGFTTTRYDYVLSGSIFKYVLETLHLFGSHWEYWDNEDLFYFILNKIEHRSENSESF